MSTGRYANCPAATVSVKTRSQLATAITRAEPGTVIKLAAGNYGGGFDIAKRGTKEKPIWICGPKTAVLDGVPDHRDSVLTDDERQGGDCMMICVSRARGDRLVLDL